MIKSEDSFLVALFETLEESGFGYCVLRNYEDLPKSLGGSDLDLVVMPDERDRLADIIIAVADQHGGKIISEYTTTGRYIKFLGCYKEEWWGAAIDLMPGLDYKGIVYLGAQSIIERSWAYRGVRVASLADMEMMALIKELLNNGQTRKSYLPDAVRAYQKYDEESLVVVQEAFGQELTTEIAQWLKEGGEKENVKNMALRMRVAVKQRYGGGNLGKYLSNGWRKFKRIVNPPGMVVVMTGTDGAGKTTVINGITPILGEALHGNVEYKHLRPNWIKPLGVALGKRESSKGETVTDPHGSLPSGFFLSMLRLGYYWLDYSLGYYAVIFPGIVKKSQLVIFDRYFYDIIIDPKRMRISLPRWLLSLAFFFAPKPKLVLCLGATPDALYCRKPETSLKEVTRQVEALRDFVNKNKNAVWVDTEKELRLTLDDVLSAVQRTMSKRYL